LTNGQNKYHIGMIDIPGPITQDHVAQAIAELTAAGKRPSWRAVRAHLGKGSPNTILGHLRALDRDRQEQTERHEPPTPAAITDLVGSKVWQAALSAAREQMASERQALDARLAAEQTRADELAQHSERLEEQLSEARRQSEAQITVLGQLSQRQVAAMDQQNRADRQIAALTEQIAHLAMALTGIAAAQADHRTATAAAQDETRRHLTSLHAGTGAIDSALRSLYEFHDSTSHVAIRERQILMSTVREGFAAQETKVLAHHTTMAATLDRLVMTQGARWNRLEARLRHNPMRE
jgi:chromosome segregation ATPase